MFEKDLTNSMLISKNKRKLKVFSANLKIFSNSNFQYNKRLYSQFNLGIKYIKLRETLQSIITSADIYKKSVKYKAIFETFMKLGNIMQAKTFQEISDANEFPDSEVRYFNKTIKIKYYHNRVYCC